VNSFVYLGSIVYEDGRISNEILMSVQAGVAARKR